MIVIRGLYEILGTYSDVAAVLVHEVSHHVECDHYSVIRKQRLATPSQETVFTQIDTGTSEAVAFARQYVERHSATIVLTSLDRQVEFRADQATEV